MFCRINMYKAVFFLNLHILLLSYAVCIFPIEELKGINYEVDISGTPVKKEETSQPVIYITSKSGQEFQCSIPQLNDDEISEKEATNEKEENVLELLKSMKATSCLSKSKDWWTYEFCYGHYIKQYHVENGHIIGQVITLGLYDFDYDWDNETDQEKFKHVKQKYHSQYYTNGTKCDLTGQPRNAEVRFFCKEDAGDYIYRVDEPGTCSYIITIHTSRLCSHPQLKPLPSNKVHYIPCHPVLDEEQYDKYLQKLKEQKALAEEKRRQFLSNQQERLQVMKSVNAQVAASDLLEEQTFHGMPFLNNAEMIRAFLLNVFDKEIDKLKSSLPPEKFASIKDEILYRIDTIIEESGEDFDSEFREETKAVTLFRLSSLFHTLLEKLIKAEKDVDTTNELNKARSDVTDGYTSDSGEKTVQEDIEIEKDENKETEDEEETMKIISSDQPTPHHSAVLDDDKLQVRIRRLDRKSSDASGKLHEMDFEQRKKLEQAVKEKLEKAGLDTGGRRIEVKIITAGYYDNEEGKDFQSLTDEETDQFQNMIMALLTGQQEAVQEMKRHKKLEESYKFIWSDSKESDSNED